jgi:DNA polymerase-3 subunit beta
MKFKVTKSKLLEGLQAVQNVVNIRSTLPILSNVLITAEKDKLLLTTTDLDILIKCGVDAEVTKTGSTTLPAKRLASIIKELSDEEIDFDVDDKNMAQIKCGSAQFKIYGLSEDEFPPVAKPDSKYAYSMDQKDFKKTHYAASSDETRFILNGVLMSFKAGKLTIVATDGRRLAFAEREVEFPKDAEADIILPSKAVNELMHTLADDGKLKIHAKDNRIMFEYGSTLLISKLIEGTYPNFRQVIPTQCEEKVTVEREGLMAAVRRVSLLSKDRSTAVKFTFGKNKLTVSLTSADVGEAKESLPIKYAGKEIAIAFNPEFVIDPLRTLTDDEVNFELVDELSPGVIKTDVPFLYVIMPMRIS